MQNTPSIYDQAWEALDSEREGDPNFDFPQPVWEQMKAISRRLSAHELALAGRRDEARELLAKANAILR